MMGRVVIWIKAMRAPFFAASAMSVVVGSAAAWWAEVPVSLGHLALALVGVVALHAGANLTNDYFDHVSGNDEANPHYGPFSGGSRMIQAGLIPAKRIFNAAIAAFVVGGVCGIAVWVDVGGWWIPAIGMAGLVAGYLYTAPSLRLVYRGLGEAIVGATFGPLATMGAYAVQGYKVRAEGFWCGAPVGLLVMLILLVNEVPDYEADKAAGKKTLVVRMGRTGAVVLIGFLYALVYATTGFIVGKHFAPAGAMWTFVTLPAAAFTVWWLWRNRESPMRLRVSSAAGIATHLAYAVILAAAYLAGRR